MEILKTIKVSEIVNNVANAVDNGDVNPLEAAISLKKLELIVKAAKNRIDDSVIEESSKYDKSFTYADAEITTKSSAGRYDYSEIPEVVEMERQLKALKDKHKAALKHNIIDLTTGEIIKPPIYKGGKEIISIKLNK